MSPEGRPTTIRLDDELLAELDRRGNEERGFRGRGIVVRTALERYLEVCRRHLAALDLPRNELALCCDALNGIWLSADAGLGSSSLAIVWAEIADAIRLNGTHEKWDLSRQQADALVQRLQRASYADLVALVDFVDRFWADDPEAHRVIYPDGGDGGGS